ncbi:MAG: DNA mismatch repair protein MutS [Cyanobacteria bacterium P01_H01_bin.74]
MLDHIAFDKIPPMITSDSSLAAPNVPEKPAADKMTSDALPGQFLQSSYDTVNSFEADQSLASPMIAQFLQVKQQYPGILLFYRMGDFYETFFEDALIASKALEITLTRRDAGKLGRVPMAGVPVKSAETYINKLIAQQFKIAICEQLEDPAQSKGLVKRDVVRVLSRGTITSKALLSPEKNNFIAALTLPAVTASKKNRYGLAFCDVTTGLFYYTELDEAGLLTELDRIQPAELLTPSTRHRSQTSIHLDKTSAAVPEAVASQFYCTPLANEAFTESGGRARLKALFNTQNLEGFLFEAHALGIQAAGAIAFYLAQNFLSEKPVFHKIQYYNLSDAMLISSNTRKHLELVETVRQGSVEGSLLWVLDKTCTTMGKRLIRQWINQPLKNLYEIRSRLAAVSELVGSEKNRGRLRECLSEVYDLERLSNKVANATAMPRDLVALMQSLKRLPLVAACLQPFSSFYLERAKTIAPEISDICGSIESAVKDLPALTLKDGGIIQAGYHPELDELQALIDNQDEWLTAYEAQLREITGVKQLKISLNSAFGYYIEVSRANSKLMPDFFHRKQTLTNAERYTTEDLKQFEIKITAAKQRCFDLEYQLFMALRQQLLPYAAVLLDMAHRVAALDVLQSFATVASEQNYCCPELNDGMVLSLQGCRHPVVEKILPMGQFVANGIQIAGRNSPPPLVQKSPPTEETVIKEPEAIRPDSEEPTPEQPDLEQTALKEPDFPQFMMITGPNMAGKSTYMRQVGLAVVMAHIGSFVPATRAVIGLVDALYTRIGAVDDLSSQQSTFMVEMNETAQIVNAATEKSLVIFDEIGRGTSTYDGVSIAWAVSEYLAETIGCRTLFATHYHELNLLQNYYPQIQNYKVCVQEDAGDIRFLHTVMQGSAQKSYGLKVAQMAGVPASIVLKAEKLLSQMQKKELTAIQRQSFGEAVAAGNAQLNLFATD